MATGQLVQGIADARAIPLQLAESTVPHEYRQSVLETLEQTVRNLQGQLTQLIAQQRAEIMALDRKHNVARSAYCEGLQSAEAARTAELDRAHAAEVAKATRSHTTQAEELHAALAALSAVDKAVERSVAEEARLCKALSAAQQKVADVARQKRETEAAMRQRWCGSSSREALD